MAAGVNKMQVLSIYKSLLRDSQKFCAYNFRSYALRRIRDAFRENKNITNPNEIKRLMDVANENLAIIRRQVTIGNMYKTEKLVIEPKN